MADFERPGEGDFAHDTFDQGGFALAVFAHEGHFFAAADGESGVVEHLVVAVGLAHVVGDDGKVARARSRREAQIKVRSIHFIHLNALNLSELLHAALHLHGLGGLVAEAFDEGFSVGNLLLLIGVSAHLLLDSFGMQLHVL